MRTQSAVLLSAVLALTACHADSDPLGPRDVPLPPTPFVVSNPAVAGGGVKSAGGPAASIRVAGTTYVSLPSATIAHATQATIRNLATGASVVTPVVSGGFDPLPIAATPGDTLEVVVDRVADLDPLRYRMLVPEKSPPIVVRTEPRTGKRDVPLNAAIIIVFSEPIDSGTVNGTTLLLRAGTTVLGGAIRFVDRAHLVVELTPSVALDPVTSYEVVVTQDVRDLDGDPMDDAVTVAFTSGVALGPSLAFTVQPSDALQGTAISPAVTVALLDALGSTVTTFSDTVFIALGQHPGVGVLSGTTAVAAVAGVAIFPDLSVDVGGAGYTLEASTADGTPIRTSRSFAVSDGGSPRTGGLTVSVTTFGVSVPTGAYSLDLDGGAPLSIGVDGVVEVADLQEGLHTVRLYGVPVNCTVAGLNPRSVAVTFGGTTAVAFTVSCAALGQLAFVRQGQIFTVYTDGSGLVPLTSGGGDSEPSWSPDGSQIAFVRAGTDGIGPRSDIYIMDADGTGLTRRTSGGRYFFSPTWSPDGQRLAFAALADISGTVEAGSGSLNVYEMSAVDDGAGWSAIVSRQGQEMQPAWSPDGAWVAFVSDWTAFDFSWDIYLAATDGSQVIQLTDGFGFPPKQYLTPAWSPDGQRLAVTTCVQGSYTDCTEGSVTLSVMNADGSGMAVLRSTTGLAWPTWSPDGSLLAFSDLGDIRWIRSDGSGDGGVLVANGSEPSWRP